MKELPDVEIFNPNKELIEELITAINSGESEYLSKNQGKARWMHNGKNKIAVCVPGNLDDDDDTCGQIIINFERKQDNWNWIDSEITTCDKTI